MSENGRPRRDRLIALVVFLTGVALVVGYGIRTVMAPPAAEEPEAAIAPASSGVADLSITVAGEANGVILVDLFEDIAPQHAERITTLATEGAYDGVYFHRVIEGFMAQTGDVEFAKKDGGNLAYAGRGGSTYPDLPAEFSEVNFDRGIVGMARSQNPNSANSQFFIMFEPGPFLNGQYTVVGKVIEGMDVVDSIKLGQGQNGSVIGEPDVMSKVTVIE